jgi:hypothetical protein
LLCFSLAARADIITFSVAGSINADPAIVNEPSVVTPTIPETVVQFVTGAWSQTVGLKDVSIDTWIVGTGTFNAYLTNEIGQGTTIANQIASSMFAVNGAPGPQGNLSTIFTGLMLRPGTYYLTIAQSSPDTGDLAGWPATANPVVTGSPLFDALPAMFGGSLIGGIDGTYLPGSVFEGSTANFQSTYQLMVLSGEHVPEHVPEPRSVLLLGSFILILVVFRRRGLAN